MLLALLIALFSWLITLVLPWWGVALPASVLGGWLGRKGPSSFGAGFLGVGALWLGQALYIHIANEGILATRLAETLSLSHPLLLILATALAGGLAGGLSTLTGFLLKKLVDESK